MIIRARTDSLRLDTEETGWLLHATTDDGDEIVLNIHGVAFEFAGSEGLRSLLEWRAEGEDVRANEIIDQITFDQTPFTFAEMLSADDPKSEGYGERMREGADLARKAERENR